MQIIDLTDLYDSSPYPARSEDLIQHFIVHHTETEAPVDLDSAKAIIQRVHEFHRDTRRWPGIAYPRAAWDDYYFLLRRRARNGWHTGGMDVDPRNGIGDGNDRGVACAILGTHTRSAPSQRTLYTIAEGKAWDEQQLGRPMALSGHQEWAATACPGEGWNQWRHNIRMPGVTVPVPATPTPELLATVPVYDDYVQKFGVAQHDWPGVTANLEGIIRMLQDQLKTTGTSSEDRKRLAEIDAIIHR